MSDTPGSTGIDPSEFQSQEAFVENQEVEQKLSATEKNLIAEAYRFFKTGFSGFIERNQQKDMISAVARALGTATVGIVQAPTGTGKSAAYLLPGAVLAAHRGKKLIVSTATASLQDQLAEKDVPSILAALKQAGLTAKAAVAKGRQRYVCVTKLNALTEQSDLFTTDESTNSDTKELAGVATLWRSGQWDGVKDSSPNSIRPVIWAKVLNTSATCTGQSCPDFADCPYYLNLKEVSEAQVIITNHDYLLACLVNNPNSTLSLTNENMYVFDEGHHLGDKCLSAFAKTINLTTDQGPEVLSVMGQLHKPVARIDMALEQLSGLRKAIFSNATWLLDGRSQHRFMYGGVGADFNDLISQYHLTLNSIWEQVCSASDDYAKSLSAARALPDATNKPGTNVNALGRVAMIRANTLKSDLKTAVDALEFFLDEGSEKARWIEQTNFALEIKCSPFDASTLARQLLWTRIKSAILTSATFGDIKATVRELGLPYTTKTLKLDSPLDYSRSQLIVPKLASSGVDYGHSEVSCSFIKRDAYKNADKGVLVYFTSRKHMNEAYALLSQDQRDITLIQGTMTPTSMIQEHKRRIDTGAKSVLFGLNSLAEGVDLPGAYCTCVIIAKLPFPMPNDPVLATHAEVLERRGLAAFPLLMLPEAISKFAQVVGRLIRKEGDWGSVIVLDNRLVTKKYGRQILEGTHFSRIDSEHRQLLAA
jgi:ATP-dependent DNA helicase DinG